MVIIGSTRVIRKVRYSEGSIIQTHLNPRQLRVRLPEKEIRFINPNILQRYFKDSLFWTSVNSEMKKGLLFLMFFTPNILNSESSGN